MAEGKTADGGGTLRSRESTSTDDLWEEKAEAQARFARRKLAHHVRIGDAGRKGPGREEGYIEAPVRVFSDVTDPGSLKPPGLTRERATLTAALVDANLEAPQKFDPVWRAIIGSHTGALARSCVTLELTILAFRKA